MYRINSETGNSSRRKNFQTEFVQKKRTLKLSLILTGSSDSLAVAEQVYTNTVINPMAYTVITPEY